MYALDILKHIEVTPADYDEVYRLFGPPGNTDNNRDDDLALAMAIIRQRGPRHHRLESDHYLTGPRQTFEITRAPFVAPFYLEFCNAFQTTRRGIFRMGGPGRLGRSCHQHTCRECIFWSRPGERVARTPVRILRQTRTAPRPCLKARQLNHEINAPVPHDATACTHFQANPAPPPIWAKHARRDS